MQIMRMTYNDLTKGGGEAKLHVYGVGTFPVFSGQKPYTNDPFDLTDQVKARDA